jgi:hypothetical protein
MPRRSGVQDVVSQWRTGTVHVEPIVVESCWRPMVGDTAGDFHDVIDLPDGRIVVTIGDAVGYGPRAAAIADDVRARMRRAFRDSAEPLDVLASLDHTLEAAGDDTIATAVCAIIDPLAGRVSVANAGHPPIVVVEGGGAELFEGPPDPPLGIPIARSVLERALRPDSVLFLYTDGLIERRGTSLEESLAALAEICPAIGGHDSCAAELARRATVRFGLPADDVTVVSVRTLQPAASDGGPAPAEPALLRAFVDARDLRTRRLRALLDTVAGGATGLDVSVEVIDITTQSALTEAAGILAAPTIMRVLPEPAIRVIGWFETPAELARALQLPYGTEAP